MSSHALIAALAFFAACVFPWANSCFANDRQTHDSFVVSHDSRGREVLVGLYIRELQPISPGVAFQVDEASVKDRQLWVIGSLVNTSRVTFNQVRLVIGIEHGAEHRLSVGRLVPRASRRVQVRLATDFEHAPAYLRVIVVEAVQDYRPTPQRWPRI